MKSIVIEEPNTLIIAEQSVPEPLADEVRVKVELAGICGSDSYIYRGHNPFAQYPRVVDYEFYGVIEAVDDDVDHSQMDEQVSVNPVINCGHCYPCSIGKSNVRILLIVLGVYHDGGFSEYAVVPARNAWTIPDTMSNEHTVMVEPFTATANTTGQIKPTENNIALVYGVGPIGPTTVQMLKRIYKVRTATIADRIDERLAVAKQYGADWAVNNSRHSLQEFLTEGGLKPTIVVGAACHPSILQEAITLASPAARIVLMDFSSSSYQIIQQGITGKELSIYSSKLNANKFPIVIDWLVNGLISPNQLITHTFNHHHVIDAIELSEKDQQHCCKVLFTFGE